MIGKLGLITILIFTFIANNCGDKPGEDAVAKRGYATLQPVIEALEKYRSDTQKYPDTWIKLVPKYIKELPKDGEGLRYNYSYTDDKNTYKTGFSYEGSSLLGIAECSYYSTTKSWSCSGKV
jgi:hypothetical protein